MKLPYRRLVVIFFLFTVTKIDSQQSRDLTLWYDKPASGWNEALPVGNGRLAAMIFGEAETEFLQLNEETVWAGEPGNNIFRNVYDSILQIRKLIFESKYKEAQEVSSRTFPRSAPVDNNYGMPYQPVGNLLIHFPGHTDAVNYRRELDINNAIATVTYKVKDITFRREIFASLNGSVIIVRIMADKLKSINCTIRTTSPHKVKNISTRENQLILTGTSGNTDNKTGKVQFEAQIQPKIEGGQLSVTDTSLIVSGADAITIYIAINTNFKKYNDISGNASARATAALASVISKKYDVLKTEHTRIYRRYFDRVSLDLGSNAQSKKPTNIRIAEFNSSNDPQLVSLYFQFGRYLMISGSQPGTQATNLQGKWNDRMNPPWDSKYTININTEMNYWPAEVTNLSELHQPLFDLIKDISITGRESASTMYHARGWNAHHNTDLWRITGPVDGGFYGMWPMGGAWLSQHLWYHYVYTGDKAFLNNVYPVLKSCAEFYADVLQEEPVNKWLVVAPSMSPENSYQSGVGISAGTTMDNQLVFDVFSNCIKAASVLNVDPLFVDTLKIKLDRLPPMQIGQYGQLQEWMQDWDRPNDKHRHISHLYGLYPGNQISPYRHPELFEASRNTLISRGDKSTGWSMGWKVNWWARLLDGNRAFKLISDQLTPAPQEANGQNGGTYPNLFDAHPPFQIDGNFGCTSGIAEMLLQSHDGAVHVLPALPDVWKEGTVKGLVTKGGFVIDITWKNKQVQTIKIKSTIGGNCRLRVYDELTGADNLKISKASGINSNPFFAVENIKQPLVSSKANLIGISLKKVYEYDFPTQAGKIYTLKIALAAPYSWSNLPKVALPVFKADTFDIRNYGAVADGIILNTTSINKAITLCSKKGGGVVLIPEGLWLTGPIEMKSNINLHLQRGAILLFTTDFDQYALVEGIYEGRRAARNQSPIYGVNLDNIAITGKGVIDGNGDVWRMVGKDKLTESEWKKKTESGGLVSSDNKTWFPSAKTKLAFEQKRTAAMGPDQTLRDFEEIKDFLRPNLVVLNNCRKILLEGITFQNSPAWCLHPVICEDLTIRDIFVKNPDYAQNGDGVDVESCKNVLIEGSTFDVGDDAICIKSGKDEEGRKRDKPTENVVIRNNVVYKGHGGFVIGSEMSGGARNIFVYNCSFIGTDIGLRFKTARGRGGVVENIFIKNIRMKDIVRDAVLFDMYYFMKPPANNEKIETPPVTEATPQFKNFYISHITCIGAERGIFMRGLPEMGIKHIYLNDIVLKTARGVEIIEANDIHISNVQLLNERTKPMIYVENGSDIRLNAIRYLSNPELLLSVNGSKSGNIKLTNTAIPQQGNKVEFNHGASASMVSLN